MTHLLNLNVRVDDSDNWNGVWHVLNKTAVDLGVKFPSVSVSSQVLEEIDDDRIETEPGEYYDESTLFKVFQALRNLLSEDDCKIAIQDMQNAGILFRERLID